MIRIPRKSCLLAHEKEILSLRRKRPPVPYRRIAELLRSKYGLDVQHPAIVKFVKGARRRKMRTYEGDTRLNKPVVNVKKPAPFVLKPQSNSGDDFSFTFSERYNLTRLSPEEAEALKKKLEEEKH